MKKPLLALLLLVAATANAEGPTTAGDVCIVNITNTNKTIAAWCGVTTNTTIGANGFRVLNDSSSVVCLNGTMTTLYDGGVMDSGSNLVTDVGGHCYPVCNAVGCDGKSLGVRGSIYKWKLRAASSTKVTIVFGGN